MSMFNRIMSRRAFLRMGAQLPIFIVSLQTRRLALTSVFQAASCPGTAYGSGAYGQGCYAGYCIPIGDVFPDVPDGIVDIQDITAIANRWRRLEGDPGWDPRFDLDGDGVITIGDIMMAVAHWGETCS